MANEIARAGLWLYRQARTSGLLSVGPIRRTYESVYAAYKRHVEDPFYYLSRRHPELFEGGHIIDVGANIGYTTVVFAAVLQPGFRVWAIEPASDHVRRLESVVAERRLQASVAIMRAAVSDRLGVADLVLNPDNPADHRLAEASGAAGAGRAIERVPLTTIDEEVRARGIAPVSFIKIDVQGCELGVCRGMIKTLADNPSAAVAIEFAPALLLTYGAAAQSLPGFFADRGYEAFRLARRGELVPMRAEDFLAPLPPRGYIDVLFTRRRAEARP